MEGKIEKKTILLFYILSIMIIVLILSSRRQNLNTANLNIIFITIDALRPDHLSCYGYKRNTSPNIDKLAEEGVLFSQAISQGSWTPPSIISIITSTYPSIHRVYDFGEPINPKLSNLFRVLKSKGYYLGLISGRGRFAEFRFPEVEKEFNTFYPLSYPVILADEVTQNAIKWLKLNKNKNFFLWLYYLDPHTPYTPPSAYNEMYVNDGVRAANDKDVPIADISRDIYDGHSAIPRITALAGITDINFYISQYDGEIRFVDEQIGKIINQLKELNLYDNSLIIITSDHGEAMGEHDFYFVHGHTLYDELLKVPLIIRHRSLKKNIKIDRQIQLIDLMPTILDIAAIEVNRGLAGASLLPLIQMGRYDIKYTLSEIREKKAIRTENWKLIYNLSSEGYELYNLKDDPGELRNLVNERKAEFQLLKKQLDNLMGKAQLDATAGKQSLDEEAKEKLRSLGYMQ